jgi:hydroxymethylglutaryl-CoA reductase (NADPH)
MNPMKNNNYSIVPGRGLVDEASMELRLKYLGDMGISVDEIAKCSLDPIHIRSKIESNIGSIEIPLGLVGPLFWVKENEIEEVYTAAAALEGALIASMNRGAKAISLGGGFKSEIFYQKMHRCPMYIFETEEQASAFAKWIEKNVDSIRITAEKHSNHAVLLDCQPVLKENVVHIFFIYSTGDAAGQNMTTLCTWHAMLWMNENAFPSLGFSAKQYCIEGNGSSDKKVSLGNLERGRGIKVQVSAFLPEDVIQHVLRVGSEQLVEAYMHSRAFARQEGMVAYNINVSNAIAAIFAATGQDLGSVHESSAALLEIEKSKDEEGLYLKLTLFNLVVGTVGGGTQLPKQQEVLQMMGCAGQGKVFRFASLIAGFTMALEISTFAAIVSGQFAKAHEKLGRNKPKNWLTKSQIDTVFIKKHLPNLLDKDSRIDFDLHGVSIPSNGAIIALTNRVNKKLTGFIPFNIVQHETLSSGNTQSVLPLLIKSKPTDQEVAAGLHYMAAAVNVDMATLLFNRFEHLEYHNCHVRELDVCKALHQMGYVDMPHYYGSFIDVQREIFLLFTERLDHSQMRVINSENTPEVWTTEMIRHAIASLANVHNYFLKNETAIPETVQAFRPWLALDMYEKMLDVVLLDYVYAPWAQDMADMKSVLQTLEDDHDSVLWPKTMVHHDFNPRNVAVRSDGSICVYDWELAVMHFPQRDIVEFLCFTWSDQDNDVLLFDFLLDCQAFYDGVDQMQWRAACRYALKEFILTRLSFYLCGRVLTDFSFCDHVATNAFRLLRLLK